jgi:deazaflavin-dependent oxidoreductase (nitroreductase family)
MPNDFNQQIIEEFRANNGRVGGYFEGARLLLLTTTGARSGTPHTTPVGYLPDGDGRLMVIASAGGAPRHPDWYHNLAAHPRATIDDGGFTYEARARILAGGERDRAFARAVESDSGWAEYQAKTERVIPVVILEAIPGPPSPNAATWGEALRTIHDGFRRELALIRTELTEADGPRLGAQLRVNCLTFCQGLHNHHTGEDTATFPMLGRHHPELAEVLARLATEHEKMADLLAELRQVLAEEGAEPAAVLAQVERITGDLEAHLDYEEEHLVPVLDAAV